MVVSEIKLGRKKRRLNSGAEKCGKRKNTEEHLKSDVNRSIVADNKECGKGIIGSSIKHILWRSEQSSRPMNSATEYVGISQKHDNRIVGRVGTRRIKNTQTYNRYIQKKLSSKIFTKMLLELTEEQKTWVRQTGFADVLGLTMTSIYTLIA